MADLKINFRNRYVDLRCQLGCDSDEDQGHIFQCDVLISKCEDLANNIRIEYEDIFGNIKQQIETIKLLSKVWTIRQKIVEISAQS